MRELEYTTTEVPALGKLLAAIRELTEAGVINWRHPWDQDLAQLNLHLTTGFFCEKDDRSGICIEVGHYYRDRFHGDGFVPMPEHSLLIVGGDEAAQLNLFMNARPVDAD